jgi:hypothetical protein
LETQYALAKRLQRVLPASSPPPKQRIFALVFDIDMDVLRGMILPRKKSYPNRIQTSIA